VIPRAALVLGGLGALALAFPGATPAGVALTAVGLAALAVSLVQPDSAGPAVLIGAAAAGWLLRGPDGAGRLVALAAALAVVHFAAALASAAPVGAWLDRAVLWRWALRWAATTAGGLLLVAATGILPATTEPAWTAGLALLALAGAALGGRWLGRPREVAPGDDAPSAGTRPPAPPQPGGAASSAPR
jgi:hypothetical protein